MRVGSGGRPAAEVTDGVADVLVDEVGVDGDGGRGAFARGCDDLGPWVADVAGGPDSWGGRLAAQIDPDPAVLVEAQPRSRRMSLLGTKRGGTKRA